MAVLKTSFHGNPNVGLNGYCYGSTCIIGFDIPNGKAAAKTLGCELVETTIAGTPMPGVFLVGNSRALLAPGITFDKEIETLEKAGLPIKRFETKLTCLGNNIVANDHGALVSPEFSDAEIEELGKLLTVPVKRMEVAGLTTPGACIVLNGKHGIIHRDAEEYEIEMARETLGLESLEPASVNLGSPLLKAGIIAGKEGFIIGDGSGGPEIVHIEESLGYLG